MDLIKNTITPRTPSNHPWSSSLLVCYFLLFKEPFKEMFFQNFELWWICTFHFRKIGEGYGISLHYGRESLHLCRDLRIGLKLSSSHIVMILLHMTICVFWVELVELRAKLLGIFWCCWLALSNPSTRTFGLLGFARNTTLIYSYSFFWAEKQKKSYGHSEKTYIDVFEWM